MSPELNLFMSKVDWSRMKSGEEVVNNLKLCDELLTKVVCHKQLKLLARNYLQMKMSLYFILGTCYSMDVVNAFIEYDNYFSNIMNNKIGNTIVDRN